MKNKEQIETASEMIKLLQDYVELAKCNRKLKFTEHRIRTENIIDDIVEQINDKVEDI